MPSQNKKKPPSSNKLVTIGKIASPWGVHGWIKVLSFTEQVEDILTYPIWQVQQGESSRSLEIEGGRRYGKGVIVKFRGFNTPEKVRELSGLSIAVERSALPETSEGEYYWTDLEGLSVIDHNGVSLGIVAWMMETGANDAMVVRNIDGKEIAIPWLYGTVVLEVSLERGEIIVNWDPI